MEKLFTHGKGGLAELVGLDGIVVEATKRVGDDEVRLEERTQHDGALRRAHGLHVDIDQRVGNVTDLEWVAPSFQSWSAEVGEAVQA